ncbi:YceI family protein [uncultured Flavobacterium sp.]|uniref:YceI family protein n=1 Tax=uncultured Flavobacterium sp. TaxID=165435 RepID=UPI0030EC479E|tara:strand:+ start:131644 stop:132282 length:639 start_codon:yes stop_codon:yes gene_type:complete
MKKLTLLGLGLLLFISCKEEEKETLVSTTIDESIKGKFEVDSTSSITWIGSKQTGKHSGTIKIKFGEFSVDAGKITEGKFVIDMNTIHVNDLEGEDKAKLEAHLKGDRDDVEDHFFNVKRYPEASFEVLTFTNENGVDMLEGNLTIKNKINKVKFPVSLEKVDDVITLTSPEFKINRTLWGVNYGSKSIFDDLGDKFIDDDIVLQLNIKEKK